MWLMRRMLGGEGGETTRGDGDGRRRVSEGMANLYEARLYINRTQPAIPRHNTLVHMSLSFFVEQCRNLVWGTSIFFCFTFYKNNIT
jgi:hypothetical protein